MSANINLVNYLGHICQNCIKIKSKIINVIHILTPFSFGAQGCMSLLLIAPLAMPLAVVKILLNDATYDVRVCKMAFQSHTSQHTVCSELDINLTFIFETFLNESFQLSDI